MRNPFRSAVLPAAACALAVLAGCSPQPQVLARVGDRTITADQFHEQAQQVAARLPVPPDSAKAIVLQSMIDRELVLAAAKGSKAVPDSFIARRRGEIEQDVLGRALMQQLAPQDIGVSDAEVKQLYAWRQTATHCQVVFTADEATAREARREIDQGQDFGIVATRFDQTGTVPPNGDLGFVEPGQLINPLDDVVRTTRVGAIVGPTEVPGQGWFIVKVLARQPREHAAFAQQADEIRSMIEQRKRRSTLIAHYSELRDAYQVTPVDAGIRTLYDRLDAMRAAQGSGMQPAMPQLTPAERATPIVHWDGGSPGTRGTITTGEALDMLVAGRAPRLDAARMNTYPDWARALGLQRVIVAEAKRRHLDEQPEVARQIRDQVDQLVFEGVVQEQVLVRAVPTDAEVETAFQHNAQAFAQLRSVTVQWVTLPDSATAMTVGQKVMQAGAAPLKETVPFAAPGLTVGESTVLYPTRDPLWQMLQQAFTQAPEGQLLGPVHLPDGWRILQFVHRDMPAPSFATLTPEQQEGLRNQAKQYAAQRTLKAYTDSLRTRIPVTIDHQAVAKAKWPAPSIEDMLRQMQQGG